MMKMQQVDRDRIDLIRAEVQKRIDLLIDEAPELKTTKSADIIDIAQLSASLYQKISLLKKKKEEIQRLNRTLSFIDSGRFTGNCIECGDEIPVKRLMVEPGTVFCVACKATKERFSF